MQATIKIDLDGVARSEIEKLMDRAMGSYMNALVTGSPSKMDFSQWSRTDWDGLIAVAFESCAPAVFVKRVIVIPPQTRQEIPFP